MTYYQRNLPHWLPEGETVFLTWRLHGSLPASFLRDLKDQSQASAGRKFRKAEAELDRARHGPLWLKDGRVAEVVVNTINRGAAALGQYRLHAFVVMANHVHVLIDPWLPLKRITDGLKGVSAREANKILRRTGRRFWQDESFDRWVRSSKEFERIRAYIEWNPVTAGLVVRPEHWPWSSATLRASAVGNQDAPAVAYPAPGRK
jgi:putative transposase